MPYPWKRPVDRPPDALATQLVWGICLAAVPVIYGIVCLRSGSATLYNPFHDSPAPLYEFTGAECRWLSVAYIALGLAVHFNYFWEYSESLWRFGEHGRNLAALVCVGSFFYALHLRFEFLVF